MTITGKLRPLSDKIIVSDMDFGIEVTKNGIVLLSDDAKSSGIHPRWAKVFAIGKDQLDVKVGEWILLEHGRWSRGHKYETDTGETIDIRLADNNAILAASDDPPSDVMRVVLGHLNLNVPT
jgi:co-chaperonin GroES (HSP10)